MGILCHPWCSIHVFPFWSVSDELFPSVPPLPPKSQCWAWLILSCSACSTGGVWCSEGAGLQALHVGFRVSWKRRRKISSLKHGCPSQGTALAARCEGCPLPNFFIFYVFFSLCHCHFAFFFSLTHFEKDPEEEIKSGSWNTEVEGCTCRFTGWAPLSAFKVSSYMSICSKPTYRTLLSRLN